MRKFLTVGTLILGLMFVSVANAQVTGTRPQVTEDTEVLPKGGAQIEAGYTYSRNGSTTTHAVGETLLRYGLNNRLELRLAGNSYQVTRTTDGKDASGLQDSAFGLKYKVRDGATSVLRPRVSVLVDTTLPTGAKVYRNGYQPGVTASFDWDLSKRTVLTTAMGYRRATDDYGRFNRLNGGVAITHRATEKASVFGEVFFTEERSFEPCEGLDKGTSKYVAAGVMYKVKPDIQLDIRAGYGLNHVKNDYFIGAGATKRF